VRTGNRRTVAPTLAIDVTIDVTIAAGVAAIGLSQTPPIFDRPPPGGGGRRALVLVTTARASSTVHPGWYPGRTGHIHFKIRANDTAGRALEFHLAALLRRCAIGRGVHPGAVLDEG